MRFQVEVYIFIRLEGCFNCYFKFIKKVKGKNFKCFFYKQKIFCVYLIRVKKKEKKN